MSTGFLSFLYILNPLEQFEVVSTGPANWLVLPTNLAMFLAFIFFFFAVMVGYVFYKKFTAYDFLLMSCYSLMKSMLKENLYIYKQYYFPIIFFLFFVILLSNIVGLAPYSFTVTSSFIVSFFLALSHFMGINIIGVFNHVWKLLNLVWPEGAPLWIAPFLVLIEAISYIASVFSLSIRLFANMMSGHALLKILIGFSWSLLTSQSLLIVLAVFPWLIVTVIMFLELLIAFLQAYVFVILMTLYINDVLNLH